MMSEAMEFPQIKEMLLEINTVCDVAESHAMACGMLVANTSADKMSWVKQVMGEVDEENIPPANTIKALGEWFDDIKNQLQDSNLRFELCLPDDDAPLPQRVAALQEWCRGFLLGVAMSGANDFGNMPTDTRELLTDFSRIGAEEEFDLEAADEAEISYADISQYVRIGVLLINEELQPMKDTSTVH